MTSFERNKPLLVITGPTASGKTKFAIECAKKYNGEIISADSMQIYKGLDIGTAKVSKEEQAIVKHHLIDIKKPKQKYNVYKFKKDANKIIRKLYKQNKLPIICGGTGLFINSLIFDYDFKFNTKNVSKFNICLIVIELPRDLLYERINLRVDQMLNDGLLDEAKKVIDLKLDDKNLCMKSIAYKEFIPYFTNDLKSKALLESCINKLKQNSRNYAKRQLTWLNNQYSFGNFINYLDLYKKETFDIIEKKLKGNVDD